MSRLTYRHTIFEVAQATFFIFRDRLPYGSPGVAHQADPGSGVLITSTIGPNLKKNTLAESLLYFHFHEAYHVGQLTMVAEALGKSAKYISS